MFTFKICFTVLLFEKSWSNPGNETGFNRQDNRHKLHSLDHT